MHSLFLLYLVTAVPIEGAHAPAIKAARDAALIQSGIRDEWHVVRRAAERKVPERVRQAAAVALVVHKRELKLKSKEYGNWTLTPKGAAVTWGFSW